MIVLYRSGNDIIFAKEAPNYIYMCILCISCIDNHLNTLVWGTSPIFDILHNAVVII